MASGIYALIIELKNDAKIAIGALGSLAFKKGYYIYVGSALNGLDARINRHKSNTKKLHWHIDYLLQKAEIIDVIRIETKEKLECKMSRAVKIVAQDSIKKFGCSDCKCDSHLYYVSVYSKIDDIKSILKSIV